MINFTNLVIQTVTIQDDYGHSIGQLIRLDNGWHFQSFGSVINYDSMQIVLAKMRELQKVSAVRIAG